MRRRQLPLDPTTPDACWRPGSSHVRDRLAVIPPDETDPLSVTWDGGAVCTAGEIDQGAYAAV